MIGILKNNRQKLQEENDRLSRRATDLAKQASDAREELDILKLERSLYLDLLNSQPAGIYRIRVFSAEKRRQEAWQQSDQPPFRVESVNDRACEILDITPQRFETRPGYILDQIHPADREEFNRRNEEANRELKPFRWEGRLRIKGQDLWICFESLPRPLENGDVLWTGVLYDVTEWKQRETAMAKLISKLQKAQEEIRTLRGILPICAKCKKIRDDQGYWDEVDVYITKFTDAQFSHSLCPGCMRREYPEFCDKL